MTKNSILAMLLVPALLVTGVGVIQAQMAPVDLDVLYLRIALPERPTLSNLDPTPESLGRSGAQLAVSDNNTTGKFMGYRFALTIEELAEGDIDGAFRALEESNAAYVLLDMDAGSQIKLLSGDTGNAQTGARLFFNIRAYDDSLRNENCRTDLFHTLPSYSMRTDALMQFALKKQWTRLVLIEGNAPEDRLFAQALRRSAQKFGLEFLQETPWIFDGDLRRQASAEVALFSQPFGDYDLLMISDEHNDFARYVRFNTWKPRPVMGADGLRSLGWSDVVEQWGAAQLQSRFKKLAARPMQDVDYAAWAALRAVDEAFVRTGLAGFDAVKAYLINDLELAGFKGRPLSFRPWNGQLRQPVILAHDSALAAMAPLEGFLHAFNELDSLGVDAPETRCAIFGVTTRNEQ